MNADELDGMRVLLSVAPGTIDLEEAAKMLLAHIDQQAGQIASLKAALIVYVAKYDICYKRDTYDNVGDEHREEYRKEAEERLAQAMPEIFGEVEE